MTQLADGRQLQLKVGLHVPIVFHQYTWWSSRGANCALKFKPPLSCRIEFQVKCLCRESEPRLLIIGPEGDFTMAELNLLTNHGAQLISLGPLRLRVETAALAMLSAAQLLI